MSVGVMVFSALIVVYATYEQVSLSHGYRGSFPGNSPVLAKYPYKK